MNDQITSVSKRLVKSFSRREKELKALIADYRPPSVLPSFRGLKSDVIVSGVVDTKTIDTEDGQFVVQYRGDGFIFVGSWGFSPGFRSVTRNGKHFCNNTRSQGKIFGRVFQYHEDGFKSASQAELREFLADSRSDETDDSADFGSSRPGPKRLRDIFRGHPLWRTLLATTDGPDSKASFNFNWAP